MRNCKPVPRERRPRKLSLDPGRSWLTSARLFPNRGLAAAGKVAARSPCGPSTVEHARQNNVNKTYLKAAQAASRAHDIAQLPSPTSAPSPKQPIAYHPPLALGLARTFADLHQLSPQPPTCLSESPMTTKMIASRLPLLITGSAARPVSILAISPPPPRQDPLRPPRRAAHLLAPRLSPSWATAL